MSRLVLARSLGVFLGLLSLTMLWNGIDTFRFAKAAGEYVLMTFQVLATPPLAFAAYWLWKRDRRAILAAAVGMALCAVVGTIAATYWTEPSERLSAGLGAIGASIALLIIVVLLARLALKNPSGESEPVPISDLQQLNAEDAETHGHTARVRRQLLERHPPPRTRGSPQRSVEHTFCSATSAIQ